MISSTNLLHYFQVTFKIKKIIVTLSVNGNGHIIINYLVHPSLETEWRSVVLTQLVYYSVKKPSCDEVICTAAKSDIVVM